MKKLHLLILLLFINFSSCQSQEKIDFKVGYLPEYTYTLTQKQTSENIIKYKGSKEILKKLSKNDVQNPTITKSKSTIKSVSETGKLNGDSFPLKVELLESSNERLKPGTKFYGKIINGNTKIDSISASQMSKEVKNVLLHSMETIMNQIKYPEREIKIGEGFEQTSNMKIPVGNIVTEVVIQSNYTLQSIQNGIGYFDLTQTYKLKSKNKDYEINVNGNGKGKIDYDIKKQFFTKFKSQMIMNLQTELDDFSIDYEIKSSTNQETEVQRASR